MENKPYDHNFPYKDNPAITETFADGIHLITVDGETARITLTVTRPDPPKTGNKQPSGVKVTAARLILPAHTVAELYNQLSRMMAGLEAQGIVKRERPAPQTMQ